MLGKLLGLVTAGVFVGAVAIEVLGYMVRHPAAENRSPRGQRTRAAEAPRRNQAAPQAEG